MVPHFRVLQAGQLTLKEGCKPPDSQQALWAPGTVQCGEARLLRGYLTLENIKLMLLAADSKCCPIVLVPVLK